METENPNPEESHHDESLLGQDGETEHPSIEEQLDERLQEENDE